MRTAVRVGQEDDENGSASAQTNLFNLFRLDLLQSVVLGQKLLEACLCAEKVLVERSHRLADLVIVILKHANKGQRLCVGDEWP